MATRWLVRCARPSLREPWRRDRYPCDETDMPWPSLNGPWMHVRAHSRQSCGTGRIGGLMVGEMMVGSPEGPVSLRAAACGRWLKTSVFHGVGGALPDSSGVQRRGNLLQDSWVACTSDQAARCTEDRMDRRDPEENAHADHSTPCRAGRTRHESAVHGCGEPAAHADAGDAPTL